MPFFDSGNQNLYQVSKNNQSYFCKQLADWLSVTEWHFTTLIAVCIESINELPDNADQFISGLLLSFQDRPPYPLLLRYVRESVIIQKWFSDNVIVPSVKSFNLGTLETSSTVNPDFPELDSLIDLAYWLGISYTQLEWLADVKRNDIHQADRHKHYHYSVVEKRRGGMRLIESPKALLKRIQRQLYSGLLIKVPVHSAAHGFRANRGCLTHAQNHNNKEYLFTFDLVNCFQSIDYYPVYRIFRGLDYSKEVARYLSCLCTNRYNGPRSLFAMLDQGQRNRVKRRHLAQGAPTSPVLSNLVMRVLDKRLSGLAKSLDLHYSRYADDLAFSGDTHRDWRFLEPLVGSICLEEGFELNYRKSRTIRSHQRQKITGVVVNEGPNIDRRYYDRLKAILTNCIRHGVEAQNVENHRDFRAYLLGRITFVETLNKNKGLKLLGLYRQIDFR
ncbi:hypothetical protein NBRC116583_08410 [Arenicella sp. 4NH20-0111]